MTAEYDQVHDMRWVSVPNNSEVVKACGRIAEVVETAPVDILPDDIAVVAGRLSLLPTLTDEPIYDRASEFGGKWADSFIRTLYFAADKSKDVGDQRLAQSVLVFFESEGVDIGRPLAA